MTIGIALKYDGGVVLGSDSQVTLGDAPYKTQGTKIEQIGSRVGLIAAGSVDFYKELVRRVLRDYREEIEGSDIPTVTDMVSQTMASMYNLFAQRFGKQRIEEVIHLAPVDMLIAGIDQDNKPHVFRLRPPGIYGPEENYGIVGSGIFYAGMVLKKRHIPNRFAPYAAKLVMRAIQETSEMDPYVGGEIKLSLVDPNLNKGTPFTSDLSGLFHPDALNPERIRMEDELIVALDKLFEGLYPEKLKELASKLRVDIREFMRQLKEEEEKIEP